MQVTVTKLVVEGALTRSQKPQRHHSTVKLFMPILMDGRSVSCNMATVKMMTIVGRVDCLHVLGQGAPKIGQKPVRADFWDALSMSQKPREPGGNPNAEGNGIRRPCSMLKLQ